MMCLLTRCSVQPPPQLYEPRAAPRGCRTLERVSRGRT